MWNRGLAPGDDRHGADRLLQALGLTGDEDPARLSGGEARRAALAAVLAPQPDILMLDEPTNHLDLPAIEWLEAELASFRGALVLISHDQRFLETLSRRTLWIDRGRTHILDKGFGAFAKWRDEKLEQEELEAHKLDRKIVREEHWLRYGVTARRKRNQRRLSDLHALRAERRRRRAGRPDGDVTLRTQQARSSGKLVIEATNISKAFGSRAVVDGLNLRIHRGDRIGIIGPNGAGKTTLVNMLAGAIEPDSGSVRHGANIDLATLDQTRQSLHPDATLQEVLTAGGGDSVIINGRARHVMSYMKEFLFKPEQAGTPVRRLSGGERGRLMLARALAQPSNLLILDEPTNDLDLETLDVLQEMMADYPGTVLLVSHDRSFLDRTVTSVLAFDGNGRWIDYAGGYSDMLAQRSARDGDQKTGRAKSPAKGNRKDRPERTLARKLSFKDQHALNTLPARIEALTAEIAALEDQLSAADFYSRDPDGFAKAGQDLETAQAALTAAEEEWLRLEMLREEIEGAGQTKPIE